MDNRAIGVFDSGMGGLTVWRQLRKELPNESLFYFGDGANCPYGGKPREQVLQYVVSAVEMLLKEDIKLLVVACNAATAYTIEHLRGRYTIPIVGMEPAVKPAAMTSKSGVIGILATAATLKGELFNRTAGRYANKVEMIRGVGEGFVELVEADMEHSDEAVEAVQRVLEPMLQRGADKIVLGCTHYPLLDEAMRRVIAGRDVELIDPAPAVERRVEQLLNELDLHCEASHEAEYKFLSAADQAYKDKMKAKSLRLLL